MLPLQSEKGPLTLLNRFPCIAPDISDAALLLTLEATLAPPDLQCKGIVRIRLPDLFCIQRFNPLAVRTRFPFKGFIVAIICPT